MSLKAFAILFLAGLMVQSSISVIKADQEAFKTLPDFSYINEKEKFTLNATEGELLKIFFHTDDSAWTFHPSKDGSAGTLKNSVKNAASVLVRYLFEANVGEEEIVEGRLEPVYNNVTLNFALTARGDEKNCTTKFAISSLNWDLGLVRNHPNELHISDKYSPKSVRKVLEAPGVLKDVESTLWRKVVGLLSEKLTALMNRQLPAIWERAIAKRQLCRDILVATAQKFPTPKNLYISADKFTYS